MNKLALKLRASAEKCQKKIDNGNASRETNTAKKLCQAMHARLEGQRWERVQTMMVALAGLHERGEVPEVLAKTTAAAELYRLAASETEPVQNGYHTYRVCTGKPASNDPAVLAAWALLQPKSAEDIRRDKLRQAGQQLKLAKIPGFFPTPKHLIEQMLMCLEGSYNRPEVTLCDPNGGSGAILDLLSERFPRARVITGEINPSLRELLDLKGYTTAWSDFLEVPTTEPELFDAVVMNPPFENLADCDHIRQAYNFLSVGGELVAIMSPSAFNRAQSGSSKKAIAFVDWLNKVGGRVVAHLDSGEFKESGTMVATVMVKIARREG